MQALWETLGPIHISPLLIQVQDFIQVLASIAFLWVRIWLFARDLRDTFTSRFQVLVLLQVRFSRPLDPQDLGQDPAPPLPAIMNECIRGRMI